LKKRKREALGALGEKLSVLWVNLTSGEDNSGIADLFRSYCYVRELDASAPHEVLFDLICFEFDYPDVASLGLLKKTSTEFPHIPILMISKVHSEELAIWALRVRVWEYLVAPLQGDEIQPLIKSLEDFSGRISTSSGLFPPSAHCRIPYDCRYWNCNAQKSLLDPALSYVVAHLHEKITERDVADVCNMSPFKFSRSFKKSYGVTFQYYLIRARMEKASRLLTNPNVLVADVANQVGFTDPSYFTRVFKKARGQSPSSCRGIELRASR